MKMLFLKIVFLTLGILLALVGLSAIDAYFFGSEPVWWLLFIQAFWIWGSAQLILNRIMRRPA